MRGVLIHARFLLPRIRRKWHTSISLPRRNVKKTHACPSTPFKSSRLRSYTHHVNQSVNPSFRMKNPPAMNQPSPPRRRSSSIIPIGPGRPPFHQCLKPGEIQTASHPSPTQFKRPVRRVGPITHTVHQKPPPRMVSSCCFVITDMAE